jgi:hypothetical protein
MSDLPDASDGGEELDLGEIEESEIDVGEAGEDSDASEDGEGAGDLAETEEGAEGDVAPPPRRGRETQAQRLRRQLAEKDRELAEARGFRQAAEQFRPQQPQQANVEAERVAKWEADNLPMMSPQEVAAYYFNKGQQQVQQAMLVQSLQQEDRLDKRDYDQQARGSRVHAQYRDAVERELAAERQRGNLRATRDDVLHRLVGRDAVERAASAAPAQRRRAERRVASQQTRPTNARGDGGAAGGRRGTWGDPEFDARMASEALRSGKF